MNESSRFEVLDQVAKKILSLQLDHPVRVGIDGITASGKSTFARELSEILKASKRPVIHTTLDGFHNPRSCRYARGRESAEGYYYDAYNYDGVVENLLLPLGPKGDRQYRTKIFDLITDQAMQPEANTAPAEAILIVDGSFALRPELREHWDFKIFVNVAYDIAENRAGDRDAKCFGSTDEARRITKKRSHAAHKIHASSCLPQEIANLVIQNDDPARPTVLIQR